MNTRMTTLLALGLGASLAAGMAFTGSKQNSSTSTRYGQMHLANEMNAQQHDLHTAMRKLWDDHTTWTRLFIISAANNLSNKQATTARLLQNQTDIGDAVKPFYGERAGDTLSALLKEHILIASEIVTAAKAGDSGRVADQKEKWFVNSDQIADLLSDANSRNWPRREMRDMMREHLELTLDEATAELSGDYRTSVRKYDQVRTQILKMADMLSDGIVNQFPDKFSAGPYNTWQTSTNTWPVATGYNTSQMDAGTVIPFRLNQRLSSNISSPGDRFTANIDTGSYANYQGMSNGAVLEGHVDVARAKTGDTPGVLGLAFDRVRMPDGQTYNVYGTLIGLDSKSVKNDNGRLVAKPGAKNDNLKYVGYGAGGGALVAIITKGNVLSNALIGGALGYLYGEIQKSPSKSRDVTLGSGSKFGVRMTRDLTFRTAAQSQR